MCRECWRQVMDELGRGTSTHDGVAIAAAVLRRLVVHNKCMLCFVTHYPQVQLLPRCTARRCAGGPVLLMT